MTEMTSLPHTRSIRKVVENSALKYFIVRHFYSVNNISKQPGDGVSRRFCGIFGLVIIKRPMSNALFKCAKQFMNLRNAD